MLKGYKYRIYPTDEQKVLFAKTFGCVRFVYNWGLSYRTLLYKEKKKGISLFVLQKLMKSELKEKNEWLKEVNAQSLQCAIRDLDFGFKRFYEKGAKYPTFKSKHSRQSFCNPQRCFIDYEKSTLNIPKAWGIPIVLHRKFRGDRIHNVTISLDRDGCYYASILIDSFEERIPKQKVKENKTIGIDVGLNRFAVCSNGVTIETINNIEKFDRKLRILKRKFEKKEKGSNKFNKAKRRIAKVYSKQHRITLDFLHKATYRLTHESQVETICVEDLNIHGMARNKNLSKRILESGWGRFIKFLEYKCDWYGVNFVKIGRRIPSSKQCSCCGYINKALTLSVRNWTCPECGANHDRDYNASVNIKNFGLATLRMGRPEVKPVECPLVDDRASAPKKQRHNERGKAMSNDLKGCMVSTKQQSTGNS